MVEIFAPNTIEKNHLLKVIGEMKIKGPPKLRAMKFYGKIQLIEGSHRVRAAKRLKMPIILEIIKDPKSKISVGWTHSRTIGAVLNEILSWDDRPKFKLKCLKITDTNRSKYMLLTWPQRC